MWKINKNIWGVVRDGIPAEGNFEFLRTFRDMLEFNG